MIRPVLFAAVLIGYVVSAVHPYRIGTWFFETVWVGAGLVVVVVARNPYDRLGHFMKIGTTSGEL